MSLAVGIVGLPNVGKSTLFKALTKNPVDISNYPFCTIEPNIGMVAVSDERLEKLAEISNPKKVVPSVIKFVDVAGLVKGAAEGEGLGNQFLAHLRETDGLLHVVRCFSADDIAHVQGQVNPKRDMETIERELILKDLETIEKRLQKIEKDVKQGIEVARIEFEVLEKQRQCLKKGILFCYESEEMKWAEKTEKKEEEIIKNLFLLTAKPQIYLLNCREKEIPEDLKKKLDEEKKEWLWLDLRDELDKSELTDDERKEFELEDSRIPELIKKCYEILELITFFTIVGKEESRAWPIRQGSTILEGAEKVHSDFKEKFVKAEIINWQKLCEVGSWKRAGEAGLLKTVGKDYILEDGDVVKIKL